DILAAYNAGQRDFGENRVQELINKKDELPGDIKWHLIGHLQSNKVKYVAPFVSMIHSVDSFRLLSVIDKEAGKAGRVVDCLLQVHIADETTKFGFLPEEVYKMIEEENPLQLSNIHICGVMGMATFTDDRQKIRNEFSKLFTTYTIIKESYFTDHAYFRELSMGMSGDYKLAVEEGSTMVRIGSLIFGERNKIF
ncbi:MAG TPA: YggS family pyridoxal phosphate-dependent enzyme, partial [Bacteroidales bacterium]|nr:YggS family pyridoxal phosphate-dependent enzyme [Bacteroidales bacterium]